jgi:hypothetical protein
MAASQGDAAALSDNVAIGATESTFNRERRDVA